MDRHRAVNGAYPAESSDDCVSLMEALVAVAASRKVIGDLSRDGWRGPGHPLLDSYGEPVLYRPTDGPGGKPVLISKGPDRQFGTPDDIRSDGQ